MLIDARGLACPKPVVIAEEEISKTSEGIVEVLVDNEASVKNLTRFASKNSLYVETEKVDNYWKVRLVKGYPCETIPSPPASGTGPPSPQREGENVGAGQSLPEEETGKDILLIIGTDALGKEEKLGKILMKGFFETMKVTKETPHTIFFLNAGVKLTTTDTEIIPMLKDIEAMGVEIFSCGTCLKHYNLESELKVGYRGTTNHIVEGIKDFKKTVWIG
jgi:selenium metabolism protein YedF